VIDFGGCQLVTPYISLPKNRTSPFVPLRRFCFPRTGPRATVGFQFCDYCVYRNLEIVNGARRLYTRKNPLLRWLERGEER
jgi:hypothetical protein